MYKFGANFISGAINGFILGSLVELGVFLFFLSKAGGDINLVPLTNYFILPVFMFFQIGIARVLIHLCFRLRKNSILDWQAVLFMSIPIGYVMGYLYNFIKITFYNYKIEQDEGSSSIALIIALLIGVIYNIVYSIIIRAIYHEEKLD